MSETAFRCQPGDLLGAYRLEKPLGRGGFSEVWRARRGEEPPVALKVLLHPEHVTQLREEARTLALVRGAGIVAIKDLALDHDPPYMALELCSGGDLRSKITSSVWTSPILGPDDPSRRRLPPAEAIAHFERILEILARVHNDGVVHGDLKPENVLFEGPKGGLKLADFGLSRRISQRSASLSVSLSLDDARIAGTLDYMAPEQRAGEKPTQRSDVYAAGVVLYEMLTGSRPQGRFHMPSQLDRRVPPVVDRVIACALAEDPRHRFAHADAMLGYHRAGMAADWQELAAAHESVGRVVAWRREVVLFVLVLFGLGSLTTGTIMLLLRDLGLRDHSHDQALGAALGFGLGLSFYAVALRWFRRRDERFAEIRATIEEQIGHEDAGKRRPPPPRKARAVWKLAVILLVPIAGAAIPVYRDWSAAPPEQKAANRAVGHWVSHSGVVTDGEGNPVASATVHLDDEETTTTDAEGRFTFGRVREGSHRIWASTDRLASEKPAHVELHANLGRRFDVRMTVVPAGAIVGRIGGASRAPIALLPGGLSRTPDASGCFDFRPLMAGRYAVSFRGRLHVCTVVAGRETVVDLAGE